MGSHSALFLILSTLIGMLMVLQSRSFSSATDIFLRDTKSNAFQEIHILKGKNEALRQEIRDLEHRLIQLSDQSSSLEAIEAEITNYKKLSGNYTIYGGGIVAVIGGNISTPWMTDMVNAFFRAGAEAVSVNGIRITNQTIGFDTLPQGQILLNGSILSHPYTFDVIGDAAAMTKILELPDGIFDRFETAFPLIPLVTTQKEVIQMQ